MLGNVKKIQRKEYSSCVNGVYSQSQITGYTNIFLWEELILNVYLFPKPMLFLYFTEANIGEEMSPGVMENGPNVIGQDATDKKWVEK